MKDPYVEVPYDSLPYRDSHPDRLGAIARLFGLDAPPVETARVLEVGCGAGFNTLAMAEELPDADFLGIDVASTELARGREAIRALGLTNLRLEQRGAESLTTEDGTFDYILAHGVYSWIPAPARKALLEGIGTLLSPNGVAYVSYNAMPGWKLRGFVRDAMLYHSRRFQDAKKRIEQARAVLSFLAKSVPETAPTGKALREENKLLETKPDYYLFHDHLSPENEALYLYEFLERAEAVGLSYLGDAEFDMMVPAGFSDEVADTIEQVGADVVQREQYMDFVRNRSFRRTLLVRKGRVPNYHLSEHSLSGLVLQSALEAPPGPVDLAPGVPVRFATPGSDGPAATTDKPLGKATFLELSRNPGGLRFEDLVLRVVERLGRGDAATLAPTLLTTMAHGLIDVGMRALPIATEPGPRPRTRALARYQASRGERNVTTLHHDVAVTTELERALLVGCDGTRTVEDLARGLPRVDGAATPTPLESTVHERLASLARRGLFYQ